VAPSNKLEALELALTNEAKERDFYAENARRTASEIGKAAFESLAQDEAEHYQRLLDVYERMGGKERWPEGFSVNITASKLREILDSVIGRTAEQLNHVEGEDADIEAIKIALAFEAKGEKLYTDLSLMADREEEREFFAMLAAMEREHKESLQDTLEYFQDPETFLKHREK
jgi:rubrerythrin